MEQSAPQPQPGANVIAHPAIHALRHGGRPGGDQHGEPALRGEGHALKAPRFLQYVPFKWFRHEDTRESPSHRHSRDTWSDI